MLCHICNSDTEAIGTKKGQYCVVEFEFRKCLQCGFIFVANPLTDYATLYNENYYCGKGADPTLDYIGELYDSGKTIRQFEWYGIFRVIASIVVGGGEGLTSKSWLDIGCGNGGLVRYLTNRHIKCLGAEDGWIADKARDDFSIPIVSLDNIQGRYDIVTAIEVLEHIQYPMDFLLKVKNLLNPGGIFWYTTGNSAPFLKDIPSRWAYVVPEVHISYFSPNCMKVAFKKAGLKPVHFNGLPSGMEYIILFKILKTLGMKRLPIYDRFVEKMLQTICSPLIRCIANLVNARYRISDMPFGIYK
ncbi:MAG: class I SAM-dependent methyltransferase [Holosporaceae bacterium]|jgi:SAM-dependent methyltransferase|nr:class I SAM-dependent methyltransferase [Holosporaceae bacterium]